MIGVFRLWFGCQHHCLGFGVVVWEKYTFLRLALVLLIMWHHLVEAKITYMIVDVPEDLLGRDDEVDHFPYCLYS